MEIQTEPQLDLMSFVAPEPSPEARKRLETSRAAARAPKPAPAPPEPAQKPTAAKPKPQRKPKQRSVRWHDGMEQGGAHNPGTMMSSILSIFCGVSVVTLARALVTGEPFTPRLPNVWIAIDPHTGLRGARGDLLVLPPGADQHKPVLLDGAPSNGPWIRHNGKMGLRPMRIPRWWMGIAGAQNRGLRDHIHKLLEDGAFDVLTEPDPVNGAPRVIIHAGDDEAMPIAEA